MKKDVRFLGIDDSPFGFDDPSTRVVGVVTRGADYVEGVLSTRVAVDGDDATAQVQRMVAVTRFRPMLRAVFLNGITLGGFNVVDLDELHEALQIPFVSIVRVEPDPLATEKALRKHFDDAEERLAVLARHRARPIPNGRHRLWANWRGIDAEQLPALLAAATVRGAIPEPVRLAHVIASGIERGESRGPV